ncbi:hypothetical protein PV11_06113 [Exophiala sideris]|uniref:Uncharacterized protein n=1 Tax=Exophiala sideris TaxID=1016849 RepID=A0A0D1W655_9EURO|nr:hypothetical protein PV11_06113 [Exophiala sideris]
MASSANEKASAQIDVASIKSTSTMSSLKALLPKRSNKQDKPQPKEQTPEQKALRKETSATYMSMLR